MGSAVAWWWSFRLTLRAVSPELLGEVGLLYLVASLVGEKGIWITEARIFETSEWFVLVVFWRECCCRRKGKVQCLCQRLDDGKVV